MTDSGRDDADAGESGGAHDPGAAERKAKALRSAKAALHRALAGEGGEDPGAAEDRAWDATARRLREDRPPHWG